MTDLPLSGLRVLDFAQFLAGPVAALRLADLGAEVIKIERPQGGDLCRSMVVNDQRLDGDSLVFHTFNRGKKSVTADLKRPEDLADVRRLIETADVMIHNFRPGVMERIGLGYDAVKALNPRLVYGAVSGYGAEGPWKDKPGQDLLVQALSGIAWLNGNDGDGPVPTGFAMLDVATAGQLVQGILACLVRRGVSGRGGLVEVDLMSAAIDMTFEQFTCFLNDDSGQPRRHGAGQRQPLSARALRCVPDRRWPHGAGHGTSGQIGGAARLPRDRGLRTGAGLCSAQRDQVGGGRRSRDATDEALARHSRTGRGCGVRRFSTGPPLPRPRVSRRSIRCR